MTKFTFKNVIILTFMLTTTVVAIAQQLLSNLKPVHTQNAALFKNENFEIIKVSKRNYFIKTASGKTPTVGSHSGAIVLDKETIIIDTHLSEVVEKVVATEITKISGKPIGLVINTHSHEDHTGGNSFYSMKIPILAHEMAVKQMEKNKRIPSPFGKTETTQLKRFNIEVISAGHAHSEGDLAIFDKTDSVLYTGDLYVNGYIGYLGEASFKNWIETLNTLEELNPEVVVPGHGPLSNKDGLKQFKEYLIDFVRTVKIHFENGGNIKDYSLPEKYKSLGAQFYLEENVEHAHELWKKGELNGI
jgi:cyclase